MVLLTGDMHGQTLKITEAIRRFELTAEDVVVVLGDAGLNYYGNRKGDRHRKKRLDRAGIPVFCIHGNHEMRPATISTYHEVEWHGGIVYVEDEYASKTNNEIEGACILGGVLGDKPATSETAGVADTDSQIIDLIDTIVLVPLVAGDILVVNLDHIAFGHIVAIDIARHLKGNPLAVVIILNKTGSRRTGQLSCRDIYHKAGIAVGNRMCMGQ